MMKNTAAAKCSLSSFLNLSLSSSGVRGLIRVPPLLLLLPSVGEMVMGSDEDGGGGEDDDMVVSSGRTVLGLAMIVCCL